MERVSEPSTTPARPPQVTVAAWMIMVGSVFVVLLVWDRIAGLHSLDTREALQPILDDPRMKDAGIQLADLLAVIRVVSMVAAGCATAMVVLGYQTLQRSRGARLALTVLAVPLFISRPGDRRLSSRRRVARRRRHPVARARAPVVRRQVVPADRRRGRARPTRPTRPVWPPPYDPARHARAQGPTARNAAAEPADRPQPAARAGPAAAPVVWAPPPTSAYGVPATAAVATRPAPGRPTPGVGLRPDLDLRLAGRPRLSSRSIVVLAPGLRTVSRQDARAGPDLAERGFSDHLILVVCYVTCDPLVLVWSLAAAALAVLAFRRTRWRWYALLVSTAGVGVPALLGRSGSSWCWCRSRLRSRRSALPGAARGEGLVRLISG